MEYLCHSPAETEALGERLGKQLRPGAVIAYEGAGVQDLLGGLRAADPAHQDQGDGDRLTDLYGPVQIEGGDLFLAEAQPVVAGQLNGCPRRELP